MVLSLYLFPPNKTEKLLLNWNKEDWYSLVQILNLETAVGLNTSLIACMLNRQLAEAGAHVVMAVRNSKAANDLIQKWQSEWSGKGLPLNIEVL